MMTSVIKMAIMTQAAAAAAAALQNASITQAGRPLGRSAIAPTEPPTDACAAMRCVFIPPPPSRIFHAATTVETELCTNYNTRVGLLDVACFDEIQLLVRRSLSIQRKLPWHRFLA